MHLREILEGTWLLLGIRSTLPLWQAAEERCCAAQPAKVTFSIAWPSLAHSASGEHATRGVIVTSLLAYVVALQE